MKTNRTEQMITELIETLVNGNSIKGNITYENMVKRITVKDILEYAINYGYTLVSGSKTSMLKSIADSI